MNIEPVALDGSHVRLEPLSREHLSELTSAGKDPDTFRWFTGPLDQDGQMEAWLNTALKNAEAGGELPFATTLAATGEVIGSTRFMTIDRNNRRVEIGSTWITPAHQRSPANTEAKLLMMTHAFEVWGCIRVEFKTHHKNEKSRNALLRIGAKEEGILRHHMIMYDGSLRNSVYFSVLEDEWPDTKAALETKMAR